MTAVKPEAEAPGEAQTPALAAGIDPITFSVLLSHFDAVVGR